MPRRFTPADTRPDLPVSGKSIPSFPARRPLVGTDHGHGHGHAYDDGLPHQRKPFGTLKPCDKGPVLAPPR